jgi:hypothetical protein
LSTRIVLIISSLVALLMVSSAFVVGVYASSSWQGNDNGEFTCHGSTIPCEVTSGDVGMYAIGSTSITYSSSNNEVSLQYNPDNYTSANYQTKDSAGHATWFQTLIYGSSPSCIVFSFQVYDMDTKGLLDSDFSNGGSCTTVSGAFVANAHGDFDWSIYEYTDSSGYVNEVDYSVQGGGLGGGSASYTDHPELYGNWYWLISNSCWCGMGGQYATFSAGSGSLYYSSNVDVYSASPPTQIATAEDSNMYYGCFSGFGSTTMSQSFSTSSSVQC